MAALSQVCSICGREFEPQFRYQMEERTFHDASGQPQAHFAFFCSQECLEASHHQTPDDAVTCKCCATRFRVELATHVLFANGQRHYVCSQDCRSQVLAESRGQRLGALLDDGGSCPQTLSPASTPLNPAPAPSVPSTQSEHEPAPVPPQASRAETGRSGQGPQVLAVFNHKGGTGKTTTAVTVAAGLAERGQRVLLVDTDGQGNVAVSLGLKSERSLYHVLVMGLSLETAVVHARSGLDVLPSNETLAAAELYLAGRKNRDRVLASRLRQARDSYDMVVVDCSPSLSLMNQNALVFADAVLCPVACDYLSLVGVRQVLRTIKQVNKLLSHPVGLWGILPTMFDGRARICREALDTLRDHFQDRCLEPIRAATRVKEAPAQGKTLLEHAPGSSPSEDYLKVVDRLLSERRCQPASQQCRAAGGVG